MAATWITRKILLLNQRQFQVGNATVTKLPVLLLHQIPPKQECQPISVINLRKQKLIQNTNLPCLFHFPLFLYWNEKSDSLYKYKNNNTFFTCRFSLFLESRLDQENLCPRKLFVQACISSPNKAVFQLLSGKQYGVLIVSWITQIMISEENVIQHQIYFLHVIGRNRPISFEMHLRNRH